MAYYKDGERKEINTELDFIGKGTIDGENVEITFKTKDVSVEYGGMTIPKLTIMPAFNKEKETFFQMKVIDEDKKVGEEKVEDLSHLKKIMFTLHNINSYEDKEKLVSALTNNGYVVGAELIKDKNTYVSKGWKIDIYE